MSRRKPKRPPAPQTKNQKGLVAKGHEAWSRLTRDHKLKIIKVVLISGPVALGGLAWKHKKEREADWIKADLLLHKVGSTLAEAGDINFGYRLTQDLSKIKEAQLLHYEAAQLSKDSVFGKRHPQIEIQNGHILLATNNNEAALACYDRALARDPSDLSVRVMRAYCLKRLGNFKEAKEALIALRDQLPQIEGIPWSLGTIALMEGNFAEAEKHLSPVARKLPKEIELASELALATTKIDPVTALDRLEELSSNPNRSAWSHAAAGFGYLNLRQWSRASREFEEAYRGGLEVKLHYAQALFGEKKYADARKYLRLYRAESGEDFESGRLLYWSCYLDGLKSEASKVYGKMAIDRSFNEDEERAPSEDEWQKMTVNEFGPVLQTHPFPAPWIIPNSSERESSMGDYLRRELEEDDYGKRFARPLDLDKAE